jgi:hypothetical protein
LRVENYQGHVIIHCLNFRAEHDSITPERPVIILSAFTGSPNNKRQNFEGMIVVVENLENQTGLPFLPAILNGLKLPAD